MMSVATHVLETPLAKVRDQIARACAEARRDPTSVTLVAISKTFGADAIEPVIAAGQRVFGENRVQEAKAKWPALKQRHGGIELHLVGSLQSNKAKEAVALFDAIHSVDRPSLAEALAKEIARQGRTPTLFVEVNTGAEPQKAGVLPEETDAFLNACRERQDRAAQRPLAIVHGHERGLPARHRVRRHPCAARHRDLRREGGARRNSALILNCDLRLWSQHRQQTLEVVHRERHASRGWRSVGPRH